MDYIEPESVSLGFLGVAAVVLAGAAAASAAVVWRRRLRFLVPSPAFVVWGSAVAFALVLGAAALGRHYGMATCGLDLGYYANAVYGFARGRFFIQTLIPADRFLNHCAPLLATLAPFTYVFRDPAYLLPLQTLLIASGVPLVYAAAKPAEGSRWPAAALAVSFALSPALHGAALFDFHPRAFGVPLALAAFYFFDRKRFGPGVACVAAMALAHEEFAIHAVALAACGGFAAGRRRAGLIAAGILAAYFAFFCFLLYPKLTYAAEAGPLSHWFLTRHFEYGGHDAGIQAVVADKAGYVGSLVAPVLTFLPAAGAFLLAIVTPLVVPAASSIVPVFQIGCQYPLSVAPFLFGAAAVGARRLVRPSPGPARKFLLAAGSLAAVAVQISFIVALSRSYYAPTLAAAFPSERDKVLAAAVKLVPPGVPACADDPFIAHLAHREYAYLYPYCVGVQVPVKPEALLLNRRTHVPGDLPRILAYAERWGLTLSECNGDYAYFAPGEPRDDDELLRQWFGTVEEWQCWTPDGGFVNDGGARDGRALFVQQELQYEAPADFVYPPGRYALRFRLRPGFGFCRAVYAAHFIDPDDGSEFRSARGSKVLVYDGGYQICYLQLKSRRPFRLKFEVRASAPFYFDAASVESENFTVEALREMP